ncbi:hypothetical protein D3C84_890360 [compost metagenome]
MLVVITMLRPPRSIGFFSRCMMRRDRACASSILLRPTRMQNSSPPKRAIMSSSRRVLRIRSATTLSNWSPAAWPRLSLIRLKWSMSRNITASDWRFGSWLCRRWANISVKARRFSRLVSGS